MAGILEGRLQTLQNVEPEFVSATRGPVTINFDDDLNHTIVAAPGSNKAIAVTMIMTSTVNDSGDYTINFKAGTGGTVRWTMAERDNDVGKVVPFNPPWLLPANTAFVVQRVNGSRQYVVNCMFYTVDL